MEGEEELGKRRNGRGVGRRVAVRREDEIWRERREEPEKMADVKSKIQNKSGERRGS